MNNLQEKIRNILTLRYDPRGNTVLPKLGWRSFTETKGIAVAIKPAIEGAIIRSLKTNPYSNIGIGISGGVDSTTVLALIRKNFPNRKINSYCVTFGTSTKEVETAQYVSDLYNTDHKHINISNPLCRADELIKIVDEPRWNVYPTYLFEAAKADGCQVIFTGDGGDELFGGYTFRYQHILDDMSTKSAEQRYLDAHSRDWVDTQKQLFAFDFRWEDIYKIVNPYFNNPLPDTGKIFLADYNGKLLYDFEPTSRKLAANIGIDIVAPFLEPEVLHLATHLPFNLKYDRVNNIGKIILRQILLESSAFKPVTWVKTGWGMNISELWEKHGYQMATQLLSPDSLCVSQNLINPEWFVDGFSKADSSNLPYVSKMLQLIALELWLKGKEE